MKKLAKLFAAAILSILYSVAAHAQDDETTQYYRAYNTCSPLAQKKTIEQCHYAQMVEGYYLTCMKQNGFSNSEENMNQDRYDQYLKSYRQCTTIANGAAQKQCNYGVVYQGYYNKCMSENGFNSNGERINTSPQGQPQEKEDTAPGKNPADTKSKDGAVSKFFDSIM